jgi:RNA-directed DNA polymerase
MEILNERRLTLSRKKSRMGSIHTGFHFLGVHYLGTQPQHNTNVTHSNDDAIANAVVNSLTFMGGGDNN